jgi:hypothetical protein
MELLGDLLRDHDLPALSDATNHGGALYCHSFRVLQGIRSSEAIKVALVGDRDTEALPCLSRSFHKFANVFSRTAPMPLTEPRP